MCSSFTWGTVSVHYLLGLPLAYALRSATPNGLMLLELAQGGTVPAPRTVHARHSQLGWEFP